MNGFFWLNILATIWASYMTIALLAIGGRTDAFEVGLALAPILGVQVLNLLWVWAERNHKRNRPMANRHPEDMTIFELWVAARRAAMTKKLMQARDNA